MTAATAASWPSGDEPALRLWPVCSSARRPCTGASRTRYMTAKCGPDHRSMAPAYRQACSHGQHWRLRRDPAGQRGTLARVTTGAAPCTLAQSDVEASRCGCFAHAMHSVQGAARCANHRDAPRCRCTQVVMHRGARCTSVHGDARRAKMRCLSQYLTSLVFLVLLQCCPRVKETFNRAGMHLGAGAHSVQ